MLTRREFLKLSALSLMPSRLPLCLDVSIQDLIDRAEEYTCVEVPPGTYLIHETITCRPRVSLNLKNVVLRAAENVHVLRGAPQANIWGGYIDCSNVPGFDHAGLLLDGSDRFSETFFTSIHGTQFLGPWQSEGETGTAIHMHAAQGTQNEFIYGVQVSNVGISYFQRGLWLQATPSSGENTACINGNNFSNLIFDLCRRSMELNAQDWRVSVDGNMFSNVQVQPGANAERVIKCEGDYNSWMNLMVWDWPSSQIAIELTENSGQNMLMTGIYRSYISNLGIENHILP